MTHQSQLKILQKLDHSAVAPTRWHHNFAFYGRLFTNKLADLRLFWSQISVRISAPDAALRAVMLMRDCVPWLKIARLLHNEFVIVVTNCVHVTCPGAVLLYGLFAQIWRRRIWLWVYAFPDDRDKFCAIVALHRQICRCVVVQSEKTTRQLWKSWVWFMGTIPFLSLAPRVTDRRWRIHCADNY